MSEKKKTMISLVTAVLAVGVSVLANFFLSHFVVKEMGEEANGFAQLANNFVSYAMLFTIALNSMAGRFMSIAYYRGEVDKCRKYYSSVVVGNIAIIGVLIVPAIVCVVKLNRIVNIDTANVEHVKVLFACVFLNFFASLCVGFFSLAFFVKNAQYLQNTINMVRVLLNAMGLLALFTLFAPKIYYISLIGLVLTVFSIPMVSFFKRKLLPSVKFSPRDFDFKYIVELILSGIWNTVTQCGNLLMTGFDLLLSNLLLSPGRMGVLAVAKTVPTFITSLGVSVNSTFAPDLTMSYSQGDRNQILNSLRYSVKCSSFVMSIPLMMLCIYGRSFYTLWMPTMNAKELSLLSTLTCVAFIPLSGTQTLYNVFTVTNKLKVNSISIVVGGIVNIISVCLLLRLTSLDLYAVAGISSLVSILRNLIITVPYSAYVLGLKKHVFFKDVGISVLCCAISGVICFAFSRIIVPDTWITLFVSAFVAGVVVAVVLFVVLLNSEEKKKVANKLRRNHGQS
ncbi:MAG: hypothetical protein J5645_09480 [Lachnospiraceae bacterium]|nr:hypothetical protein [Lachnospiraceae bacterium]